MEEEEKQTGNHDFVGIVEETGSEEAKRLENAARLQELYDKEKEQRLEERFLWVFVVAIMFNSLVFLSTEGFLSFFPVFMLQLILLFGLAKMWGVDWAVQSLDWLMHQIATRFKSKE